ncbi:hypothetical protein D3C87_125980 [compost metagenome]
MIFEFSDYRDVLQKELKKRCDANPSYSLRAFAAKIGLTSSTLSEILNRKAGLSQQKARLIAVNLNFTDVEQDYFATLVQSAHARSNRDRETAKIKLRKFSQPNDKKIDKDTWKFISEWYHVGILELSKVKGFKSEPRWISEKLGISAKEARLACDRLVRLGILRVDRGTLKPTGQWLLTSPDEIPSDSIKLFHMILLKKASSAIYEQALDQRNYSSLIMAVDTDKIAEAKKMINEFNRKINTLLTSSSSRKSLYCFGTQLFRLGKDS